MQKKKSFEMLRNSSNAVGRAARNVCYEIEDRLMEILLGGVMLGMVSLIGIGGYAIYLDGDETDKLDEILNVESDGARVSLKGENAILFVTNSPEDAFTFDLDDKFVIEHSREKGGAPQSSSFEAFNNAGMLNRAIAMACAAAAQAENLPDPDTLLSDSNAEKVKNARQWGPAFEDRHCGTPAP